MSPDQINAIANWIALSAIVPYAGYTLTYGLASPWFRSLLGIVMFSMGAAITLVLGYVTVRRVFGDFPGFEWWSIAIYSLLALAGYALWAIVIVERRRAPLLQIPLKRKAGPMTVKTADGTAVTVPPIWYKAKRVLRTALATLISALSAWAALQLVIPDVLAELASILPASWILWLTGVVAIITAVASALTRIMAIPRVNDWLTKFGFGSVPKDALEAKVVADASGDPVHVITTVAPDPKAVEAPFDAVG